MAATTTRLIHLRPVLRHHPSTLRHFSSDPAEPQPDPQPEPTPKRQTQTPFSSYLNEVKASLQKEPPPQNRHHQPFSFPKPSPNTAPPPPSKSSSLEEIRRHLSEYRKISTADARPPTTTPPQLSFQELYKKNVTSRSEAVKPLSFDAVRQSLSKIKAPKPVDPMSLSGYQETLRMKPKSDSRMVIGGSVGGDSLSSSLFGKEKQKGGSGKNDTKMATLRLYSFQELGGKLKMLRPDKKKWKSFTLQELKDRLVILSDIEAQKSERNSGGLPYTELRDSLMKMRMSAEEKEREQTMQRLDMLSSLGETPSFMLSPPKEHLVEKYFHPDNMSSAEKLKLELKKVRDEFKMSESDCGSARVQVAQLTTKIKHLSTVLQKKDKHSRKGLQAMVQRRKKLLKYLRRTDWDSYSLVLSKLGLRDNPDIKA